MKELLFKLRKGQILFQNCTIMPNYIAFLKKKKILQKIYIYCPIFGFWLLLKKIKT